MSLEERIAQIEQRNQNVSRDKAWETSLTRKAIITVITWLCASVMFLFITPHPQWYLAACVPVMGYVLSTLGLPWGRRVWERARGG